MSDITYARKADRELDVQPESVPEHLAAAQALAGQASARALREIDGKLKYVADQIVAALLPGDVPERWITWGESGGRVALAVHRIVSFEETKNGTTLELIGGEELTVPISYGTIAMMVGA